MTDELPHKKSDQKSDGWKAVHTAPVFIQHKLVFFAKNCNSQEEEQEKRCKYKACRVAYSRGELQPLLRLEDICSSDY